MNSMLINAMKAAYQRQERVSFMSAANYGNPGMLSTPHRAKFHLLDRSHFDYIRNVELRK